MRALALLFLFSILGCKRSAVPYAPDDESLRRAFDDHRTAFNDIADFFDANPGFQGFSPSYAAGPKGECHTPGRGAGPPFVCGTTTVTTWNDVASAIGVTTLDDVRAKLALVGFCSASRVGSDLVFWLSCSHDASWEKEIVLTKSAPSPIVADTTRDQTRLRSVYRSLGGSWYIHRSGSVP